jgi:hypothetical protein
MFSTEGECSQLKGFIHDPRGWGLAKIDLGAGLTYSFYKHQHTPKYLYLAKRNYCVKDSICHSPSLLLIPTAK